MYQNDLIYSEQVVTDLLLQFDAKAKEILEDSLIYQTKSWISPENPNNYYDSTGIRFAMGFHLFNEELKKQEYFKIIL